MPAKPNQPVEPAPSGEIVSTRVFAATPDEVFAVFGDASRLVQWWGPKGFTNVFHAFDFRPGGVWRFTMRGPDGAAYEMDKQFVEIVRPARIVLRHFQQGHGFTLTMLFEAHGGGTAVTWRMRFDDPAECARVRGFVVPANEQNLDRLAAHLSAQPTIAH